MTPGYSMDSYPLFFTLSEGFISSAIIGSSQWLTRLK